MTFYDQQTNNSLRNGKNRRGEKIRCQNQSLPRKCEKAEKQKKSERPESEQRKQQHTMNTKHTILKTLQRGKPVTLSRLTELTGSTKGSTRISDLRKDGHNIVNRVTYKQGAFLKSTYTLLP